MVNAWIPTRKPNDLVGVGDRDVRGNEVVAGVELSNPRVAVAAVVDEVVVLLLAAFNTAVEEPSRVAGAVHTFDLHESGVLERGLGGYCAGYVRGRSCVELEQHEIPALSTERTGGVLVVVRLVSAEVLHTCGVDVIATASSTPGERLLGRHTVLTDRTDVDLTGVLILKRLLQRLSGHEIAGLFGEFGGLGNCWVDPLLSSGTNSQDMLSSLSSFSLTSTRNR